VEISQQHHLVQETRKVLFQKKLFRVQFQLEFCRKTKLFPPFFGREDESAVGVRVTV